MRVVDAVSLALRSIRARALESGLVVLGVALGIGVISATLSLDRAFRTSRTPGREELQIVVRLAAAERARDVPVRRVSTRMSTDGALDIEDIDKALAVSPDAESGYVHTLIGEPGADGGKTLPTTAAVTGAFFGAFGLPLADGRLFTVAEEADGTPVAVLGGRRAALLFPDGDALGGTIQSFGLDYRIVGVLGAIAQPTDEMSLTPDDVAYIPLRSSPVYDKLRHAPELVFLAKGPDRVRAAAGELRSYFEGRLGAGAVTVESSVESLERESAAIRAVITALMVFAGSALLIACVNTLNVLLARLARRVRATGITVALGSTRREVFSQYLMESSVIGLVGCALGVPCGLLFVGLMNALFDTGNPGDIVIAASPGTLGVAVLAALALTILLGVVPAWRASGMNAADAVRAD